jgi:hypothetical protein
MMVMMTARTPSLKASKRPLFIFHPAPRVHPAQCDVTPNYLSYLKWSCSPRNVGTQKVAMYGAQLQL